MFAKLPLLFALLSAATLTIAAPVREAAPACQGRALADPFPKEKIPKDVRYFRVATGDLKQTCKNWKFVSDDWYKIPTKSVTIRDCKTINKEANIIAAYTTQFRDDGTNWSQTGYVGTQLTLEFLVESDGKCNEVTAGLCCDPVQEYAGRKFD